jgi:hypothetical protein
MMTKTLFALGASAAALLATAGAIAAPGDLAGRGKPTGDMTRAQLIQTLDARFAKLDANGDGTITKEDMQAVRKARHEARFAKLDTDRNGSISRAEFDAAGNKRGHDGRRGGHGRRGMGAHADGPITKADFQSRALARFDRMDADHDGIVTAAERQAAWSAMKARPRPAPKG